MKNIKKKKNSPSSELILLFSGLLREKSSEPILKKSINEKGLNLKYKNRNRKH